MYLNKYDKILKRENFLYIMADIFTVGAFLSLATETNLNLGVGCGLAAAGTFTLAYTLGTKKRKHIRNTIQAYNKF